MDTTDDSIDRVDELVDRIVALGDRALDITNAFELIRLPEFSGADAPPIPPLTIFDVADALARAQSRLRRGHA